MSRLWDRSHAARLRVALLTLVVFGLDTITNVDIVVSILYVNVVLLAMRSGRKSDVAVAGCSAIVLTAVSYLMTMNAGHPSKTALLNSLLSVLAIACVTVLCLKNLASQGEVLRARDRVALMSRGIVLRTISASVVHEVSQPLTAIGANAKAAQRWLDRFPPDVDETRAATRRIVAEAERAANVIGRLRRLMRPGDLSSEVRDVRGLIEAAIEHLRFEIDAVAADVTVVCPATMTIEADGVLIEQVIVNALSNALDAMRTIDGGERAIRIEARSLPPLVKIAVKDSGMGVDEATLERMFDPFFTTKLDSGMGIGLAVSRSIIDAHGGSIRAVPNTPRGLIVELVLPAEGSKS